MHLKDDCSHVISEIQPQGSNQPRATSGKSKGDNSDKRKIASQSGKYGFYLCVFMFELIETLLMVCRKFWTTSYSFLDNVDYVDIYIFLDMI
jgi:hypothetical protein